MTKKRVDNTPELRKRFIAATKPLAVPALAVGIDVTWWGGSGKASERNSRKECIAYALKTKEGWGLPDFRRVDLTRYNPEAGETEPNADPDGQDLVAELMKVTEQVEAANKVIALDAPLISLDRELPPRKKAQRVGEVERRACDRAWAACISLSPDRWRAINIQPGSPLPTRIVAILDKLKTKGFTLYTDREATSPNRVVIECFPNEVIWSAGVLGRSGQKSFASMVAYKVMGKSKTVLPLAILEQVCIHALRPCLEVAGLDADGWLSRFWQWLAEDKYVVCGLEGVTGKCFDDAIDSLLSLISAAAFVDGTAHVHQGDPGDGHIIGPGLFS